MCFTLLQNPRGTELKPCAHLLTQLSFCNEAEGFSCAQMRANFGQVYIFSEMVLALHQIEVLTYYNVAF